MEVCQSNPVKSLTNLVQTSTTKAPSISATTTKKAPNKPSDPFESDPFFDDFDDPFDDHEPFKEDEKPKDEDNGAKDTIGKGALPDHMFDNYDDYYYYADDDDTTKTPAKRHRRSAGGRRQGECVPCQTVGRPVDSRPTSLEFRQHLKWFLKDNPGPKCPSAGQAAYRDCVRLVKLQTKEKAMAEYSVKASDFMAFHTILKTSEDYTQALRWSRMLTDTLSKSINADLAEEEHVEVFAYSIFYVFYEQYLTIWEDTLRSLGVSLLAIFIVTFILMGLDLNSSLIILLVITMVLVNMGGLMYWWSIQLNAVSLVNLVMAVGISVEFCAHITRAFAVCTDGDKVERAQSTLINMGSSVSSGSLYSSIALHD